jgi:hypothetical protein
VLSGMQDACMLKSNTVKGWKALCYSVGLVEGEAVT